MSNMSYCRFENTLSDLRDCKEALENQGKLSNREAKKAKVLIELCRNIADNYDDDYVDSLKEEDEEEEEE